MNSSSTCSLSRFACPDLTCQGGFWCKALPERFSVQNRVLHFVVDQDGNLNYGINGVNRGIFISKINIHGQLWALFDIYGNSRTIEFLGECSLEGFVQCCFCV